MQITGYSSLILLSLIFVGIVIELIQDDMIFQKYNNSKHSPNKVHGLYECQQCGARFRLRLNACPVCGQSISYDTKQ